MSITEETSYKGTDWIMFAVSTLAMIALLIFATEWFWLALPFSSTYLVRALDKM